MSWSRPLRVLLFALVAVAALMLPAVTENSYYLRLATLVAIGLILTTSLNLIYGYAGQISIGHIGFYAVGAYATALAIAKYDQSFWVAWPAAAGLTAAVGWVIGRPVLRLRHFYLAVATLGFGVVVHVVINRWNDMTGGPVGVFGITRPAIFGRLLDTQGEFYVLAAAASFAILALVHVVVISPFGRTLRAIREGEVPVASLGIDPARKKLLAFTISALLAGIAGGLFATLDLYIGPGSFGVEHSILLLAVLVIGGLGRESGAIVAAFLLVLLPELVRVAGENQHLVYSVALLASTLYLPSGVAGVVGSAFGALARRAPAPAKPDSDDHREASAFAEVVPTRAAPPQGEADGILLEARGLRVTFGGFLAIDNLDITIGRGELLGLIGANGAGKSTFINAITGIVPLAGGEVFLYGDRITSWPTHKVAAAGVVRTFQTTRLFAELTVAENVMVAASAHNSDVDVRGLLELVDLGRDAERRAGTLPFGRRRLLELVRAVAARPRLLLLDEPAAGLNEAETEHLAEVLLQLRDAGLSLLLVEHDLALVLGISDRVVAMGFGAKLAEGRPQEVIRNERVIESYLGTRAVPKAAAPASTGHL